MKKHKHQWFPIAPDGELTVIDWFCHCGKWKEKIYGEKDEENEKP